MRYTIHKQVSGLYEVRADQLPCFEQHVTYDEAMDFLEWVRNEEKDTHYAYGYDGNDVWL